MDQKLSVVHEIRAFNREYTNLIGLMNRHLLNSKYTFHELRILYEVQAIEGCTSKNLKDILDMDGGYLSRVLKKLEKNQLIEKRTLKEDLRKQHICLTSIGRQVLQKQINASNQHINALVKHLDHASQMQLVGSMKSILANIKETDDLDNDSDGFLFREHLQTGDLGYLTYLHAKVYKEECGYDLAFEGYVCKTFAEFTERYSPDKDKFFIAEHHGQIVGCVAILGHSDTEAQLRWFIVLPEYRGQGLGKKLYKQAMDYCYKKGFKKVWLLTTSDQIKASSMYKKSGFKRIEETPVQIWGRDLVEEKYVLNLD